MTTTLRELRPPAWAVLEQALTLRQPVSVRYHGRDRVLCPHAIGWKKGRLRVLSYQISLAGSPSSDDSTQRWRCMFLDEIENPALSDAPWQTAPNYSPGSANGIDALVLAVEP